MKELQDKLQQEIADLKKQLEERTGQLDKASTTIIARNDEITELKTKLAECQEFIEKLQESSMDNLSENLFSYFMALLLVSGCLEQDSG